MRRDLRSRTVRLVGLPVVRLEHAPREGPPLYPNGTEGAMTTPQTAPVQGEYRDQNTGRDRKYHCGQSAERLAERGGFGWFELVEFLGHEPRTWRKR